jgi:predicted PurR-regulated permease PerM
MKRTFTIVLTVVSLLLFAYVLFLLQTLVLMVFVAFLIALAVAHPIRRLRKLTKLPIAVCGGIVYTGLIAALAGLVALVIPAFVSELTAMMENFDLQQYLPQLEGLVDGLDATTQLLSLTEATLRMVLYITAVIVLSFYLSLGKNRLIRLTDKVVKQSVWTQWIRAFMITLEEKLGGWLRARAIISIYVAVATFILLTIMGVPYALALAILAGVLDVVSVIGPIIATVPAALLAWSHGGLTSGIIVVVFYTIINQVEGLFVAPLAFKKSADLSPAVSILGIIGGYTLFGMMGAFLAIPLIIVGQTFLECVEYLPKLRPDAVESKTLLGQD